MSGTHVVQQSMYLRSRQSCHFDVEVIDETCNWFEDVSLGFCQTLMDCHLEVAAENFNGLFEANVVVREV